MDSWLGQYCINVTDLEASVRFYEALGLTATSRTEIPDAWEAIVEDAGRTAGKLQLAQQKANEGPIDHGNALWKLYVDCVDIEATHRAAVAAGAVETMAPTRMDRWPVTVAFVTDPDGYTVELVERHPWPEVDGRGPAWIGQYCLYVSDLERTIAFYESAGLTCTSRTDIEQAKEAILESGDGRGGKLQLAQKLDDDSPIAMGTAMWKLYVNTDDCDGLHRRLLDAGYREHTAPILLERWNTTMSYVLDPDGYLVELVTLPGDRRPG